ncbi:hypothetical protein MIND_01288900 [Mycena indigotica]|uniref:BTB domain-containing protein n=1 Tax=Mycena indigotica TaxID=2126181 RepID=A0A8H6VVB2_9AGAR|nr:uncharacterized protein MIND_01288900 [Mycena indigotica]KAF7291438.1 hypothetical protein MIND_01288900 [Mycena indigotica]
MPEAKTISFERFSSADADLTFCASDNVLFKVHRKNLEVHSEVFGDMFEAATKKSEETIGLSEPSAVLEVLFQYMYRQPQPSLDALPFSVCAGVAEAAEKYLVYSAMTALHAHMRANITRHPLVVLNFAVPHDFATLANDAARHCLQFPLEKAVGILRPDVFARWAVFYDKWHREASRVLTIPNVRKWPKYGELENFLRRNPHRCFTEVDKWNLLRDETDQLHEMQFVNDVFM